MQRIGSYPIKQNLASLHRFDVRADLSSFGSNLSYSPSNTGVPPMNLYKVKVLDLGLLDFKKITKRIMRKNKNFDLSENIKRSLSTGKDFFRVTLVASFAPGVWREVR
jgi:hypothetical protein